MKKLGNIVSFQHTKQAYERLSSCVIQVQCVINYDKSKYVIWDSGKIWNLLNAYSERRKGKMHAALWMWRDTHIDNNAKILKTEISKEKIDKNIYAEYLT